ncbi:MAG TPA: outer membrane beta-barrel protein [Xanthobacteraceae bacterium]|nr:outer membrane beta-barrel protein [Xanthobacteraceae bacterium]
MDRRKRIFGFAAAALAVAGMTHSAFAKDLAKHPAKNPPPAPLAQAPAAVNWTGLYAGGTIGSLFVTSRHMQPGTGLSDDSIGSIDPRPTYGFYGGFNYQFLSWAVAGIEYAHTKFSSATYRELGSAVDFLDAAQYVDSISGRLGVLLMPETLVYGKVGTARMKVQSFQAFAPGTFEKPLPGTQVGVGIETLVTPNIALRAEASYTYSNSVFTIPNALDQYRPGFMLYQVGAAFKLDPPTGWGTPASAPAWNVASLPFWELWNTQPATAPKTHGMVTKAPPPVQTDPSVAGAPNWTGLEAGGFISGNGNRLRYNDSALGETGPLTDFVFGGGWLAGADYQFQRIVVGAEASGNYEAAHFNTPAGSGGVVNVHEVAKIDRVLAVTGRIGWLATPETLFYGKVGPAWLRMTPNSAYWNATTPNAVGATTFSGYQAGVGVETYVTGNISVRAETLYTYTGRELIFNGVVPSEFTIRPSILSAIIGLALHI